MNFNKKFNLGFTLIELLVTVAIISILAAVVFAALGSAKMKGIDSSIKSNLNGARSQAEIFWNTNTAVRESYTSVCTNGRVGGVDGIGSLVLAAAKAYGLASYANNTNGTTTTATCNDSATAWAAEVPMKTSGQMWCVDSAGVFKQVTGTSLSSGVDYTCN